LGGLGTATSTIAHNGLILWADTHLSLIKSGTATADMAHRVHFVLGSHQAELPMDKEKLQ
jgi:hypothetical protein